MIDQAVVDASVAIKLFVEEEHAAKADRLFQGLAETPPSRLFVHDLFYFECANILWKYVWRYGLAPEEARRHIADLRLLPLQVAPASSLLEACLALAIETNVTAYDASYAVLARSLQAPLVTADERLTRKLAGSGIEVLWLGDFSG